MDIRVLKYFLAVAREENITKAAEVLHISQPPLSRQLKDLEDELGKQLFIRGKRKITLTEEGLVLRKRAEEILELLEKTRAELSAADDAVSGDVYIGGAETDGIRTIAKTMKALLRDYPQVRFHFFSGNAESVTERLDKGLLDFGILLEPADMTKYDFTKLPGTDVWGVLMRKDSPLARHVCVKPRDLFGLPVIVSNQVMVKNEISGFLSGQYEKLNIVATYNLLFNAALMVEEGVGYALCLDKIINTSAESALCFRPFEPKMEVGLNIVWKKYQVFSKPARIFLERLQKLDII